MRPRNEAIGVLSVIAVLGAGAGWLGRTRNRTTAPDERVSSFVTAPGGAAALFATMPRLGIATRRFRERTSELHRLIDSSRQALVVLAPLHPFSAPERSALLDFSHRADLVIAGKSVESLMRCFGYRVTRRILDSTQVSRLGEAPGPAAAWVRAWLTATSAMVVEDSSRAADVGRASCRVPEFSAVDTLLVTAAGRPVALRLTRADRGSLVVLVADEELFRNRALRLTDAGPFALGLFAGHYDQVIFEEYHHGFGASGSLAGATMEWSRRSPWGWAVWQAAVVGFLALAFGAVRFGPAIAGIPRTRRSPLEHVRALATALAAARGHDEAIGAMVRGLRRRLLSTGPRTGGAWRGWLAGLRNQPVSPRARAALDTLDSLTRPGQPSASVLGAANAVEDLWEDLRP